MGVDIRIWAQIGDINSKYEWPGVNTTELPYPGRDRLLFSLMSGYSFTNPDIDPIFNPRGIPDPDFLPREWDNDPHGRVLFHPLDHYDLSSWLLPSELRKVIWTYESHEGRQASIDIRAIHRYISTYEDDGARILFGFSI